MKFAHVIEIPAPPDRAFSFLLDLPRVARCLPGASDLRAGDHDRYLGDLRVDIGPFHLTLAGDVTILSRDEPTAPDGDGLVYSADNLPPGLTIDDVSGLIAGTVDPDAGVPGSPYAVVRDVAAARTVPRRVDASRPRHRVRRERDPRSPGPDVRRARRDRGERVPNPAADGWRVLARLAVRFDSKARPHPEVVMLTSQRSGFSGVEE